MAAYSLPRGPARERNRLRAMLFEPPGEPGDDVAALTKRIELLEAKLQAISRHPDIDPGAVRAAIEHTQLVCVPGGYTLAEVDEPPPAPGDYVEHGGITYTVWQLGPSPYPGDGRRCAILV